MPKTIKKLAGELYVLGFRKGFNSNGENVAVDFSKEISQFTTDLLTLIDECVGREEKITNEDYWGEFAKNKRKHIRNEFRKQINSAISERSGIK